MNHCSLAMLIFFHLLTFTNLFPLQRLFHYMLDICLLLYDKFCAVRDHGAILLLVPNSMPNM